MTTPLPVWDASLEVRFPDGSLYLLELLEVVAESGPPDRGPHPWMICRSRPLAASTGGKLNVLTPQEPAASWLSPVVGEPVPPADGPALLLKRIKTDGCRVDFEAFDEASVPDRALRDAALRRIEQADSGRPLDDPEAFRCNGCRRMHGKLGYWIGKNGVRLCTSCWLIGLIDGWCSPSDRCGGEPHCTEDSPWRPDPARPSFTFHQNPSRVYSYRDWYDTAFSLEWCEHCGHAWCEASMK